MVAMAQNVFDQRLFSHLVDIIPRLTSRADFDTGVTRLTAPVPKDEQSVVIDVINESLTWVWYRPYGCIGYLDL